MQCINKTSQVEELIKKSRFISFITPCQTESEVKCFLQGLYEPYQGASHIAFAYRLKTEKGIVCRFSDAGEPSGTAGKPIFKYLEGYDLINTLIVVVRYFGGVKLGAGGLTRAYGNAAKLAITEATLVDFIEQATLKFELDYKQLQLFEYQLPKFSGIILSKEFVANIKIVVQLPEQQADDFLQLFMGQRI